jgi:hypothetical protein
MKKGASTGPTKGNFPRTLFFFIHWEAIGHAVKGLPRARRNFITKFV